MNIAIVGSCLLFIAAIWTIVVVELQHAPAKKVLPVLTTENYVGIGDRRVQAPEAIARRSRPCTRAVRPHPKKAAGIHEPHASAARPNRMNVYRGSMHLTDARPISVADSPG
jgi:hypothetical protein